MQSDESSLKLHSFVSVSSRTCFRVPVADRFAVGDLEIHPRSRERNLDGEGAVIVIGRGKLIVGVVGEDRKLIRRVPYSACASAGARENVRVMNEPFSGSSNRA